MQDTKPSATPVKRFRAVPRRPVPLHLLARSQHTVCHHMPMLFCIAGDLSVAVLGGDIKCVQGVLDSGDCSQQQLDEALELAAMLCRVEILQLLLVHGADPGARGAAALTWAVQRRGEPQKCWALLDKITPRRRRRSSSSISSSAGHLAVAVWCRGLQDELSGLRDSTAPQPQLQSLQQFLRDAKPGQRTVANLLTQLHQEWPELFAARQSSRVKFSIEDVWASPAGTAPPQNQAREGTVNCLRYGQLMWAMGTCLSLN